MTLMNILAYITIGLVIGWLSRIITKDRGVTMFPSLAFGVLGAVAGTAIVHILGLAGAAFYAVVGAVGMLFTVNVFRQDDPIFSETEAL
ncbi:GlsB/YeaQ/YmgE family stress response membrane protein [Gracilimonas halophila]|uniref:GlsB/YeaQ/YmgE family stress response membrane protein n=1 Tax=Gracilimonas halophila TaxID=1834464 RepID=A0ABW5JG70_9BACT